MAGAATNALLEGHVIASFAKRYNCEPCVVEELAKTAQHDIQNGIVTIKIGQRVVTNLKHHGKYERAELLRDYLDELLLNASVSEAITALHSAIGESLIETGTPEEELDGGLLLTDTEVCLYWVYFKKVHARALWSLVSLSQSRFNIKRIESYFLKSPSRDEILPLDPDQLEMAQAIMLSLAPKDVLLPIITSGPDNLLPIVAVVINIAHGTRNRNVLTETDAHQIYALLHAFKVRPTLESTVEMYQSYVVQEVLLESVASLSAKAMAAHLALQSSVDAQYALLPHTSLSMPFTVVVDKGKEVDEDERGSGGASGAAGQNPQ